MDIVLPEVISQQIYTYGFFDETVTWLALHAARQGDTVIDVGAHFGYFSLLFSHMVGFSGRVISFEPTPSTYAVLSRNVQDFRNVTALNAAAGAVEENCQMTDYGLKYCAWNTLSDASRLPDLLHEAESYHNVKVICLDHWLAAAGIQPNVVKIDAENCEDKVIAGLSHTLKMGHPRILMETGSVQSLKAGQVLLAEGYRVYVSEGVGSLTCWKGTLEEANTQYKDILFASDSLEAAPC